MSSGEQPIDQSEVATWRLAEATDVPFVYRLVTQIDPRWYRFSRHGLEPSAMIELMGSIAAGAIVQDAAGQPVACAILTDSSESGTGTFEYYALPTAHAQQCATQVVSELLGAVFVASSPRRLYVERFENDPVLLGDVAHLFTTEVVLPDFLSIDGVYETRATLVLTAEAWREWSETSAEVTQ